MALRTLLYFQFMPTSNDPLYPYRSKVRVLVSMSVLLQGSSTSLTKAGNSLVPGGKKKFRPGSFARWCNGEGNMSIHALQIGSITAKTLNKKTQLTQSSSCS
jgi:hypothetical protein